jgi:excisionase family DNA binding protein
MSDMVLYTAAEVAEILRMNHQVVQRKLQAGEIPAYRIGREWRVEKTQLLSWLERHSNQRARTPEERVLASFFTDDGKLRSLPAPHAKRKIVLQRLLEPFEKNRTYTEPEVNDLLRRFHDDVASLRRELIAWKMLSRTRGVYRRASAPGASVLIRG